MLRHTLIILAAVVAVSLSSVPAAMAIGVINIAVSDVSSSSAVLVVKTDTPSDVGVDYGTAPGTYTATINSSGLERHELALDGLSPSTTVYYRVTITNSSDPADTTTLAEQSFSSAKAPGDPFSFAVTGDNRPNSDTVTQPPVWSTIVSQVAAEDVDLFLNVGDIIYGMAGDTLAANVAKFDGFFETIMPLTATTPLFVAVGNHELINSANNRAGYEQEFTLPTNNGADAATYGEEYYSFDYGDTHFIALCTEIPGQEGMITGNQQAWLEADLAANDKVWTVAFMHRPLFSGTHPLDPWMNLLNLAGRQNRDDIHALFVQYGVDVVFEGHEHHYLHSEKDGVQYVISGGGGAPLSLPSMLDPDDIFGAGSYQHMKVEETTATMEISSIDTSGQTLETFTLWSLDLNITASDVYWDSYQAYLARSLTVDYLLSNDDSTDLSNIQVVGLEASGGVVATTSTPFAVADIAAGESTTATIVYSLPAGTTTFNALTHLVCQDLLGNVYELPGSTD